MGEPRRLDNFMAKDRFSSSVLARCKSRNSSGVNAAFIFTRQTAAGASSWMNVCVLNRCATKIKMIAELTRTDAKNR